MDDVQKLVAEREIRNLVSLYGQHADDGAAREWSELFAEDGALQYGPTRTQGRAALAEWLSGTLQGPPLRHVFANVVVTVDSDTGASGTADVVLLLGVDGAWTVGASVRYTDRFVNTAEGWRIAERVLDVRSPAA